MVLWETVLSPALQVLFDKLASGDILELLRRWNFDDLLLEKLKIAYFTCTVVIDDAEEKQYDNPAIQTWLDMLKNAVYEAEDTLDELATEALRWKIESSSQNFSNQVRNWNILVSNFNPFNEGIEAKIEKIIDKLDFIAKQKDVLGLESCKKGRYQMMHRGPTTPLLVESHICGRDDEKEEIFKFLLADGDTASNTIPSVIPILGMGGIGKTTLAQIVYNEQRIDDVFDVKAWACVSDGFDLITITKALVESSTGIPCESTNLELLQSRLRQILSTKKFLIVLDDVWEEDYENWIDLLIPSMVGALGSRIIVTTRNEGVLSVLKTLPPYRLKEMSNDACWQLFLHHAFGDRDSEKYLMLKEIGREMVKRCKGLPLAVKMLGGLLASRLDIDYWNDILTSNLWDLPPKKNMILPSLRLSYQHLPSNLKRCFAYCSIFPKGYEFDRKMLVLLWMAEGFLQPVESINAEEVGEKYFSELLSRSFFQESSRNKSQYVIHDLVADLAQSVSRRICFRQEENWKKKSSGSLDKVRHFSYIRSKYDVFKKFELLPNKWLRTFLPLASTSTSEAEVCYLTKKVPRDLLPKLRCLRVLSLSGYCITELPELIGNLRLIRYIDLSYTQIKSLPESLCSLCNLQTLLLCYCNCLNELPANLGKLVNLRHLDISRSGVQQMPIGIGNLVSLQKLPEFKLGTVGSLIGAGSLASLQFSESTLGAVGSRIGELRNLVHLGGSLSISGLEHVANYWDVGRANLKGKQKINELYLEWSSNLELQNETVAGNVLEMLRPHQNLEELTIKCYPGTKFPTWIGDPVFSKLVSLSLSDCKTCRFLPHLGCLPSLIKLHIRGMGGIKSVGLEFYGFNFSSFVPFASLETLSFVEMIEWEDWFFPPSVGGLELFPSLQQLYLEQCPKLQTKLPEHFPSLVTLVLFECGQLSSALPSLPKLHSLNLRKCNYMLLSSNLEVSVLASFELCNISNLTYLPEQLLSCMNRLQRLLIIDCSHLRHLVRCKDGSHYLISLQHLVLRNCSLLVSLFEEEKQLPQGLEYLELDCCQSLKKLPQALHSLTALKELIITDCPRLQFVHGTIFPSNLKGLVLRGCDLEFLSEPMLRNISSLDYLYISGCLVLSSFPRGGRQLLPTTFKQLTIDHCPNLELLPEGMMHNENLSLELLEIFDCPSLVLLPAGQLPITLKTITLWNCPNLETISDSITEMMALESLRIGNCTNIVYLPSSLHKLRYLEYLEIDGCPGIISFPDGGLPATSLKKLRLINCENLKFLPEWMQNLTSLKELMLSNCPSIASFPEGGLPTNLVSLELIDCKNIIPLSEWGLHRFPALKKLKISGSCQDLVFPEWLLPSTLDTLHIGKLPNLESLAPWLQNLTSLEELKIKRCHKLISMPKEGVPPMLSFLEISECSLLQQSCEKNWSEIDHVPCIVM